MGWSIKASPSCARGRVVIGYKHLIGRTIVDVRSEEFLACSLHWVLTLDDGCTVKFTGPPGAVRMEVLRKPEDCSHVWQTERNTLCQTWERCNECGTTKNAPWDRVS